MSNETKASCIFLRLMFYTKQTSLIMLQAQLTDCLSCVDLNSKCPPEITTRVRGVSSSRHPGLYLLEDAVSLDVHVILIGIHSK